MSERDEIKKEGLFEGGDTTVTLTLDDGSTLECVVLTIFEASNGKEYIAVMPETAEYRVVPPAVRTFMGFWVRMVFAA